MYELIETRYLILAGLAASALVIILMIRRLVRHERPDEPLANVAMLLGLGWSAEAVWELTGPDGADFPTGLRVALCAVGEVILIISMVRTKRAVRETGSPGRAGRAVWSVAAAMALVGALAAEVFGEGVLRALIPLGLTLTWWQGAVPEGAKRADGPSSWRWTPRRALLAIGAIEPGERDVETVHRERMIQTMTKLEFRRRSGSEKLQGRRAARLSRLSLLADDDMIDEVRARVARASWYTVTPLTRRIGDAGATHPTRRTGDAPNLTLTSGDALAPQVRRGLELHRSGLSLRVAATQAGTSEAAIRRAGKKVNGHDVLEVAK